VKRQPKRSRGTAIPTTTSKNTAHARHER